jgi:hypothetical protein
MKRINVSPEERIKLVAVICRKYQLCDAAGFRLYFPKVSDRLLQASWVEAKQKVRHKDIIKDADGLDMTEIFEAERAAATIPTDESEMHRYLHMEFNPKLLNRKEEQIQRRSRHLVAKRYVDFQQRKVYAQLRARKRRRFLVGVSLGSSLAVALFGSRIWDGFTPVNELTQRLYDRSIARLDSTVCNDGWTSPSQGQGACSHHGGIRQKFSRSVHTKTLQECRVEAEVLSWMD